MPLRMLAEILRELLENYDVPRGVRNFPSNCDPRQDHGGYCFAWEGYRDGYPGPARYKVEVSNAQPPNDVFNGTWYVPIKEFSVTLGGWLYEFVLPGGQRIQIVKYGFNDANPGETSVIVEVGFDCSSCVPPRFDGYGVSLVRPLPSDILPDGTPAGDPLAWPTPVHVEPRGYQTP